MKNEDKKSKRQKDQFLVTVVGVIIYSVILIAVMAGTYIGVKSIIKNYDAKLEAAAEATQKEAQDEEETESNPEPEPEVTEEDSVQEDELNEHKIDLSAVCDSQSRTIDYSKELFSPAKRDTSLTWQDNVFSNIENTEHPSEALINTFRYKRVYGYLLDGTEIVYDVYTNPENDLIEKIRTATFNGDQSEIITYYYSKGNINYISQYSSKVDVPVDISSAKIGSRYYFCQDEMVKYVYCSGDIATEYTVADIGTYSEGTVEQYDYLEKKMINSAYITYNVAVGLPDTETVTGYVLDEFNQALSGAKVQAISNIDGSVAAEAETDGDGKYSFELETTEDTTFTVEITKDTLIKADVHRVTALPGAGSFEVEPVYMSYDGNVSEYNVQILVRDATDMTKALPNASIKFRDGINSTDGDPVYEGTLNEAGAVIVPIRAGNYTAQVSLGGYEDAYFTVIVKQDHQAVLGYAIPDLSDNTFATVLSWDTTPLDLDARVISSNAYRVVRGATDSIGSTTPEVIYIENAGTDEYNYFVSDYTAATGDDSRSYNMSSSNANVTIYNSEGMVASYHVPIAHSGIIWNAFKIRNKEVLPVNRYYYAFDADTYWTSK